MTPEGNAALFFADARDRQKIYRLREAGHPPPWTSDPIIQSIYLCNVFREQDKTTVWFREDIRDRYRNNPTMVLAATVLFRWFNRIETGQKLFPDVFLQWFRDISEEWVSPKVAGEKLASTIEEHCERPYFTGAYMIKLENGVDKHLSVAIAAGKVLRGFIDYSKHVGTPYLFPTLREWTKWLMQFQGLGGFMAYEIVTDLRWTCLAEKSTDIMTWANTGPGCARGLSRIHYGDADHAHVFARSESATLETMKWLLELSRHEQFWPQTERQWEMREVEHFLCEFDKIQRARTGEGGRIKRKYTP